MAPPKLEYSTANHCTLIAMQCTKNARPINTILDDKYQAEVEMLRPGATYGVFLFLGNSSYVQRQFNL
ncbi:hypothetical protein CPB83DRAFT_778512 [Crepidotus variabilis]|uniref:Uncharacterized protein n=1 Tax=Crepidotus variabilis TaxID=179855 RepID=A0A9P6E301_9AGAR|nr:hypothetical protein CPB83DRAFT_778512 [Crepidotus variabilis]